LTEMLQGWGISVKTAEGARQAIGLLERTVSENKPPPLIISDVNMPDMDGFMLAEHVRSTASLRDTAIILLTSGGRPDDIQTCDELGISSHLLKPVKQSELLEAILVAEGRRARLPLAPHPDGLDIAAEDIPSLKILLAEDGKTNRVMAVALLTKWGHKVVVAENGREAIERWQAESFDAILMDIQMPVLDGLAATRRIRELESAGGTRMSIIAVTARAMPDDRQRCLDAGMDAYVTKPLREPDLIRALRTSGAGGDVNPETTAPGGGCPIDWDAALGLVGGDRELLGEALHAVEQEVRDLAGQLEEALATNDAAAVRRLAHTIKGSARAVAAMATGDAAAAVEESAARADLKSARHHMHPLHGAIRTLLQAIRNSEN
jgi:CheY-like chemotaxis protein